MSTRPPPLSTIFRGSNHLNIARENQLPPIDSWSMRSGHPNHRSSSPARSSSPPRTPYSSRESDSYAFIHHSSPVFGHGLDLPLLHKHSQDPTDWASKPIPFKPTHSHPISEPRYSGYDAFDLPPSSEMEVEDIANDSPISPPEIDSETTSDSTPGHGSMYFSDSEEDMGLDDNTDDDGTFSFGYSTLRLTCFRVSSERGQWKDDPMALKPSATSNLAAVRRLRQSVPTPSRQPSENPFVLPSRLVSEPLPTTTMAESPAATDDRCDGQSLPAAEVEPSPSSPSTPHSDRPITPEPQALPECSSPLPPSSPVLSPMSGCVSSMSRSVSPLSLPPSSPSLMPSNCDDEAELPSSPEDALAGPSVSRVHKEDGESMDPDMRVDGEGSEGASIGIVALEELNPGDTVEILAPLLAEAPMAQASLNHPNLTRSRSTASVASGSSSRAFTPDENTASAGPSTGVEKKDKKAVGKAKLREQTSKPSPLMDQDDNSEAPATTSSLGVNAQQPQKIVKKHGLQGKRKAEDDHGEVSDAAPAPAKKRKELTGKGRTGGNNVASTSSAKDGEEKEKKAKKATKRAVRAPVEDSDGEDDDNLPQQNESAKAQGKGKKRDKVKTSAPSASSSTGLSKRERVAALFALESPQKPGDGGDLALGDDVDHAEIKGMIIECMATSRASSMPVSLVTKTVLQAHPRLKKERTEKEWRRVMARVLVSGMAGKGSGVFGKVDSSGKDDSDRPLEAQWFYVPEMDEDQDRAALIRSMMPRPGKRSVTKQYKQYYWRPLDKISRWDPDDAL